VYLTYFSTSVIELSRFSGSCDGDTCLKISIQFIVSPKSQIYAEKHDLIESVKEIIRRSMIQNIFAERNEYRLLSKDA
jgi:hypothetical protein